MLALLLSWSQGKIGSLESGGSNVDSTFGNESLDLEETDVGVVDNGIHDTDIGLNHFGGTAISGKKKRKKNKKKKSISHSEGSVVHEKIKEIRHSEVSDDGDDDEDDVYHSAATSVTIASEISESETLNSTSARSIVAAVWNQLQGMVSEDDIQKCMEEMWTLGLDYDNVNAVLGRLQSFQRNAIQSPESPSESVVTPSKQQMLLQQRQDLHESNGTRPSASKAVPHANKPAESASDEFLTSEDKVMIARLEQVAAYAVSDEAIAALIKWLRLTKSSSDRNSLSAGVDIFLRSRSLELLVGNMLSNRGSGKEILNSVSVAFNDLIQELTGSKSDIAVALSSVASTIVGILNMHPSLSGVAIGRLCESIRKIRSTMHSSLNSKPVSHSETTTSAGMATDGETSIQILSPGSDDNVRDELDKLLVDRSKRLRILVSSSVPLVNVTLGSILCPLHPEATPGRQLPQFNIFGEGEYVDLIDTICHQSSVSHCEPSDTLNHSLESARIPDHTKATEQAEAERQLDLELQAAEMEIESFKTRKEELQGELEKLQKLILSAQAHFEALTSRRQKLCSPITSSSPSHGPSLPHSSTLLINSVPSGLSMTSRQVHGGDAIVYHLVDSIKEFELKLQECFSMLRTGQLAPVDVSPHDRNCDASAISLAAAAKDFFDSQLLCIQVICSRIHASQTRASHHRSECSVFSLMNMKHMVIESEGKLAITMNEIADAERVLSGMQSETVAVFNLLVNGWVSSKGTNGNCSNEADSLKSSDIEILRERVDDLVRYLHNQQFVVDEDLIRLTHQTKSAPHTTSTRGEAINRNHTIDGPVDNAAKIKSISEPQNRDVTNDLTGLRANRSVGAYSIENQSHNSGHAPGRIATMVGDKNLKRRGKYGAINKDSKSNNFSVSPTVVSSSSPSRPVDLFVNGSLRLNLRANTFSKAASGNGSDPSNLSLFAGKTRVTKGK